MLGNLWLCPNGTYLTSIRCSDGMPGLLPLPLGIGLYTSHLSRAAGEVGRGSGREGAVMKHESQSKYHWAVALNCNYLSASSTNMEKKSARYITLRPRVGIHGFPELP